MKKILFFITAYLLLINVNAFATTEKFVLDPYHTNITWHANHFGFSTPNGKFAKSEGYILLDEENPKNSSVKVTIYTDSIVTGIDKFDEHLKSKDFFNVKEFKTAEFISTKVKTLKRNKAKIYGNLTILGVTKLVVLKAKLNKIGEHPFNKKKTVGFSAHTTIKRSEFGINYALGGVADDVIIHIETEASLEK